MERNPRTRLNSTFASPLCRRNATALCKSGFRSSRTGVAQLSEREVIAIDSKILQHSSDTGGGRGPSLGSAPGPVRITYLGVALQLSEVLLFLGS